MTRCLKLGLILLMLSPGLAGAQSGADEWEFALTPFIWAPGVSGTIGVAGQETDLEDIEVSTEGLAPSLDFAFMANFEARRNRWSFAADVFYMDLGKDVTVENTSVSVPEDLRLDLRMIILEGDVGYQVANSLDVLAGFRGASALVGLEDDEGTLVEVDGGFTDPIVGLRFRRYLSEKFWVSARGDVGGFGVGSDFSWFVNAAGGFHFSKLISLGFDYRIWEFDYESDNELRKIDLKLAGIGVGLTFHF